MSFFGFGNSTRNKGVRDTPVDLTGITKGTTKTVAIINRGICDNANVWSSMASGSGVLGKLIFRNIDISPFTAGDTANSSIDYQGFLMLTCFNSLRLNSVQMRMLLCIGEGLMPMLDNGSFLPRDEARKEFVNVFINEWGQVKALLRIHLDKIHATPADPDQTMIDDSLTFVGRQSLDDNAKFCMRLLKIWVDHMEENQKKKAASVIVTFLVSMAWRGMVTPRRLTQFTNEMDAISPGLSTMCTQEHVLLIWNTYGPRLTDENVGTVFSLWYDLIPPSAIRCRVVLQQAAGSGLTSLDVIARAVKSFPTFPWHKVGRMYPEEWSAAFKAIATVGTNKWYGYRQDLGPVRSTLYRNISWVGKELLVRTGLDPSLKNKQGWITAPLHPLVVEKLVADYLASIKPDIDLTTASTEAEGEDVDKLLDMVKDYPANVEDPTFHVPAPAGGAPQQP